MVEMNKTSRFSTLAVMAIKDLRLERNIPLGAWAEILGKTPSAVSKIENFQSTISLESIYAAGQAINISPSKIMSITESMIKIFNSSGFYFSYVLSQEEDELCPLVMRYFSSPGYENYKKTPWLLTSLLNIVDTFPKSNDCPTIIQYCCDASFREWFDRQDGKINFIK